MDCVNSREGKRSGAAVITTAANAPRLTWRYLRNTSHGSASRRLDNGEHDFGSWPRNPHHPVVQSGCIMSDPAQSRAVRAVILECLLAAGLGLLLLAVSAAQQLRTMNRLSADWGQLRSLLGLDLGGTPLGSEVAKFVGWQVAL